MHSKNLLQMTFWIYKMNLKDGDSVLAVYWELGVCTLTIELGPDTAPVSPMEPGLIRDQPAQKVMQSKC